MEMENKINTCLTCYKISDIKLSCNHNYCIYCLKHFYKSNSNNFIYHCYYCNQFLSINDLKLLNIELKNIFSSGKLEQIKYLIEQKEFIWKNEYFDEAASNGHLDVVKFLHSIGKDCTTNAMDDASNYGHIEIVKFLHSIGKDCTTKAMDWASKNGHLEIVKYLHSIGKEYTEWAMDWASENGHLEVVKFLHSIGAHCTRSAMDWASENGHLEVVKFLHSIRSEEHTSELQSQ